MELEKLIVPLILDDGKFNNALSGVASKASSALGGLSMVGGIATGAIVAGATAAAVALSTTITPASDLAESMNAVNVVFEEGADIIQEYGKNSAKTVGLSTAKFNQLSSVTGAFLTNLGFDSEGAADKTIELTERAADMASVFNTDVSQALEAIQSGLKGEFNPLEQFGVKINAAVIEARALEMGLGDANDELTDSAKAQAALALIMEQTDKVAGDFTNTSDGLANQQRILGATFENIKAKVGTALLPALTAIGAKLLEALDTPAFQSFLDSIIAGLTNLSNWVVTNIPVWIDGFKRFSDWLVNNKPIVAGVLGALGVAILAFGVTVATAAWTALAPMLPIIAIMALVGAAVYLLYRAWTENWGGIQEKVAAVWAYLKPVFESVKEWLQTNIPLAIKALRDWWTNTLIPAMEKVGNFIDNKIVPAFNKVVGAIKTVIGWIKDLADAFKNISLPHWLTPGSPTPLELGLKGINKELKNLNTGTLPEFSTRINANGAEVSNNSNNFEDMKRLIASMNNKDNLDYNRLALAFAGELDKRAR